VNQPFVSAWDSTPWSQIGFGSLRIRPVADGLPSPSANAHPGTGLGMCLRQRRLGCLLARPTKRDCFGRARTWSSLLPVTSATDDPTPAHGRHWARCTTNASAGHRPAARDGSATAAVEDGSAMAPVATESRG